MSIWIYANIYIYMHVYIHTYTYENTYIYVCMYTCTCIYTCVYIYTHVYIHRYIHLYVWCIDSQLEDIYMYICIYVSAPNARRVRQALLLKNTIFLYKTKRSKHIYKYSVFSFETGWRNWLDFARRFWCRFCHTRSIPRWLVIL